MLVSVHLPKTAGTSFAAGLEKFYGAQLRRDYADMPLNTPPQERHAAAMRFALASCAADFSEVRCVHGHFLPLKYLLLKESCGIEFVTWMREPVERVLSHYYYWRNHYDPANAPALHRRVMEENWPLEKFCLSAEVRNVCSQFLFAFPLEYFSFIGITGHYADDYAYFVRRFLRADLGAERLNVNPDTTGDYGISAELREAIRAHNALDVRLYERALALRAARMAQAGAGG